MSLDETFEVRGWITSAGFCVVTALTGAALLDVLGVVGAVAVGAVVVVAGAVVAGVVVAGVVAVVAGVVGVADAF